MAIDTEEKRRSVSGYAGGSPVLPVADGTVAVGDRAHVAWLYSGFNYTVLVTATPARRLLLLGVGH